MSEEQPKVRLDVAEFFRASASTRTSLNSAARRLQRTSAVESWIDSFASDAECVSARIHLNKKSTVELRAPRGFGMESCVSGGWLLKKAHEDAYWIPRAPILRKHNGHEQIAEEKSPVIVGVSASSDGLALSVEISGEWDLDVLAWRIGGTAQEELMRLSAIERQPWYLWGSHTSYCKPADLYLHLIGGKVYENRYAWPKPRKICSENDAHALYAVLHGLHKATGKRLYARLKDQVLLSVLARQDEDGAFRHGEWTDRMESHFRLHCSAMHLMMDALTERDDMQVRKALERAAGFIAGHAQRTDAGTWFLHDELEISPESMNEAPFKWIPSRKLGKAECNMLVLNTHLDTLIALDRYREVTGDERFASLVSSARTAAMAVLGLHSADWLYGPLFRAIDLTLLPTAAAKRLPVFSRAMKRVAWKYLIPRLPAVKTRFPRLVMPNGYIDRELSLHTWAHDYHSINLMDLARFYRRFPDDELKRILLRGFEFAQTSGIRQRWKEMPGKRYALGFWAEALYHLCTLDAASRYRAWLAEAMLDLEDTGQGQPPSLLGANAEALPPQDQSLCPIPDSAYLRIANLSHRSECELLVLNASNEAIALTWQSAPSAAVRWFSASGETLQECTVPARGWIWGVTGGQ